MKFRAIMVAVCAMVLIGTGAVCLFGARSAYAAQAEAGKSAKPIRALLLTGGCCHDYENQKRIITEGLSARMNIVWTIVDEGGTGTAHEYGFIKDEHWADPYDVVVHNECFATTKDLDYVRLIANVHKAGKAAVVIHCAMHTFRDADTDDWRDVLGVETRAHGRHEPIDIKVVRPEHPIFKGLWTHWKTGNEELYKILRIWDTATPLASGTSEGQTYPCVWVNEAGPMRVFGTTVGHQNVTMQSPQWMDMVARGLLWTVHGLNDDGTPAAGFGPVVSAGDWSHAQIANLPSSEKPVELFDGRSLSGWDGDPSLWTVEDGAIVARNPQGHELATSSYLFSNNKYRNFRLLMEVKQKRGENLSTMHSAVAVLGERFNDNGNAYGFKGPLLMFCNDWGIWDAYRRNRTIPRGHPGQYHPEGVERVGNWNQIEVLVIGDRIRFVANGKLVFDFTDKPEMLRASPIALQLHGNKRPEEYHFRGLVVTENPEDKLITLDSN